MLTALRQSLAANGQPLLLGVGFAVLVAINGASLWLMTRAQSAQQEVRHTLEVDGKLLNLLRVVRRAEGSQRGYLLTRQPAYLEDYRDAAASLPTLLADIRNTTVDNSGQTQRLDELQQVLQSRIGELDAVLRAHEERGLDAAIAAMQQRDAFDHGEAARGIVQKMIDEEAQLLSLRTAESERSGFNLFAVNLAGSLLILGLGGASLLLVQRSNRERDNARERLQEANLDLEATVAERTAELEEANQELQRYAYIVSHDLRAPLVNIMGFTAELESLREQIFQSLQARRAPDADAAEDEELARDYDEALGFIKSSINRMDNLINAILRISREGQRRFTAERVDMDELLRSIAATLAHQTDEAGAGIAIESLPEIVSDRIALEQVFANLLDNAVKYLDPGRAGRIEVRGRRVLSHLVYEVEDNGRGIVEKDHRRIFDLFRRSGTQNKPGEGIGLAHVRALVRRLGGRISVKSEAGQGSTFIVTLPQNWSPAAERKAA